MAGFPYAGTYRGPEAVATNVFAAIARDWEGWAAHDDVYVVEGERVVVLGRYTAVHATTRKAIAVRVAHAWVVRAGKIVRFEQLADTALVREAMT
jgi:ketosteroid isomerase-like protein